MFEIDGLIEIVILGSEEVLEVLCYFIVYLMVYVIKRLYGNVKFGVGFVIEGGFYYDFDID